MSNLVWRFDLNHVWTYFHGSRKARMGARKNSPRLSWKLQSEYRRQDLLPGPRCS